MPSFVSAATEFRFCRYGLAYERTHCHGVGLTLR